MARLRSPATALVAVALWFLPSGLLFARGAVEDEPGATVRDEWVLSVTEFDLSLLSPGMRVAGDMITRGLLERLDTVNFRLRLSPEVEFYEGYEWRQSVQAAAQALAKLQNDRALVVFRGDPNWRQRRALRAIDADMEKLRRELAQKEEERPLVNLRPEFVLSGTNLQGNFPAPPSPGMERAFARSQNADAVLFGEVREFHGRFFLRLRLYVAYVNDFVYDDDVIFSTDDANSAVEEIAARLTSVLSGSPQARLEVAASPPEAQILVNQSYAGTGNLDAVERPPGKVNVAVAASGYAPKTIEIELLPGESVKIDVALSPVPVADVVLDAPANPGTRVFDGALFVGETPLSLSVPINGLAYFSLEDGITGRATRAIVATPQTQGGALDFSFRLKIPPSSGERRVNRARARFYWSWAAFWATLVTSWISSGITNGRIDVVQRSYSEDFWNDTQRALDVSTVTTYLLAPSIGYAVFELGRYLAASNANTVPIVKPAK